MKGQWAKGRPGRIRTLARTPGASAPPKVRSQNAEPKRSGGNPLRRAKGGRVKGPRAFRSSKLSSRRFVIDTAEKQNAGKKKEWRYSHRHEERIDPRLGRHFLPRRSFRLLLDQEKMLPFDRLLLPEHGDLEIIFSTVSSRAGNVSRTPSAHADRVFAPGSCGDLSYGV